MKKSIKEFCKKYNLSENQFYGKETVGGSLWLRGLTSLPEGFNPTVGGSLWLDGLTSLPEGFNPTVGGDLWLDGLTSLPEGFNPTVGGDLWLRGLTSLPEGFNPTVGGDLWLRGSWKHIGSDIDLSHLQNAIFWNKKYAKIDGIFCEIGSVKKRTLNGFQVNSWVANKLNKKDKFVIVNIGKFYAHAESFKSGFEDLQFKIQSAALKKSPIFEDTPITVQHFRIITGACNFGCKSFMESNGIEFTENEKGVVVEKAPMVAKDLLILLKKNNAYGVDKFEKLLAQSRK